jgi:hypothetical protein
MAAGKKPFPRATTRKIIKAHAQKNIGKSVDLLVFLDYVSFMDAYVLPADSCDDADIAQTDAKRGTESEGERREAHRPS